MSTSDNIMSSAIDKLEAIVHRMETVEKTYEQHFKMYKESMDNSHELHEKRMNLNDTRYSQLRNSLIGVVIFCVGVLFTGGVQLDRKVDKDVLENKDFTTTTDAVRGDQTVVNGVMEFLDDNTEIPNKDIYDAKNELNREVYKEVTGEVTRGIKNKK